MCTSKRRTVKEKEAELLIRSASSPVSLPLSTLCKKKENNTKIPNGQKYRYRQAEIRKSG